MCKSFIYLETCKNILTNFKALKFPMNQPVAILTTATPNKVKTDCKIPQVLIHKQTSCVLGIHTRGVIATVTV